MTNVTAMMDKIEKFQIGSAFSIRSGNSPVCFGIITGYGINPSDEMVFRVRFSRRVCDQYLHPNFINNFDHNYDNEETS